MCPLYLVVKNMSHLITGQKYIHFFIGRKSDGRKTTWCPNNTLNTWLDNLKA